MIRRFSEVQPQNLNKRSYMSDILRFNVGVPVEVALTDDNGVRVKRPVRRAGDVLARR
jgi:hypothetical protein